MRRREADTAGIPWGEPPAQNWQTWYDISNSCALQRRDPLCESYRGQVRGGGVNSKWRNAQWKTERLVETGLEVKREGLVLILNHPWKPHPPLRTHCLLNGGGGGGGLVGGELGWLICSYFCNLWNFNEAFVRTGLLCTNCVYTRADCFDMSLVFWPKMSLIIQLLKENPFKGRHWITDQFAA